MLLALLLGCSAEKTLDSGQNQSCSAEEGGQKLTAVINTLTYARQVEGIANGFNLDGLVSDNTDEDGCYKPDLVSPRSKALADKNRPNNDPSRRRTPLM